MKNALTLIAVAGIASVASAQNFSLSISGAPATVAEGAVFSFDVIGDADIGTHMLGGGFTMTSGSALIANMTWTPASWSQFNTDDGYAGGGDYGQITFGQLVIPGVPPFDQPAPGSELGSAIGTFQVTLVGAGSGVIDFALNAISPFSLETIDPATGAGDNSSNGQLALNGASIQVGTVPAPSALALLGLGGLAAGRRRR
ncbi:MAG: PEP-CTERM sorting domain-containing protein [Phycisphaerales bacterium]